MSDILKKIVSIPFAGNYYKVEHEKKQVVLHHTVSGGSAKAVASYWGHLKARIATCIIIDKAGVPHQLFSSKYWGGHIGNVRSQFKKFDIPIWNISKHSIGVEIISWGGLKKIDNKFYNCYGGEVKDANITYFEEGFRGFNYFDSYTEEQIQTLKKLLIFWNKRYGIPLDYQGYDDIFDISEKALKGEKGIFGHCSYRPDKSDIFPQKEMIEMLESLKEEIKEEE